jgi:hypothetical protein
VTPTTKWPGGAVVTPTTKEISKWGEANLFGNRLVTVEGKSVRIPLTPLQRVLLRTAVEIIDRWERRTK